MRRHALHHYGVMPIGYIIGGIVLAAALLYRDQSQFIIITLLIVSGVTLLAGLLIALSPEDRPLGLFLFWLGISLVVGFTTVVCVSLTCVITLVIGGFVTLVLPNLFK